MSHEDLASRAGAYYTERFLAHGATPAGVDWNSADSQVVRFRELLRIVESRTRPGILDFGCGYGAMSAYIDSIGLVAEYTGYDVSATMIEHARTTYPDRVFTSDFGELEPTDYVVASGVFNVKLDVEATAWESYVFATIRDLDAMSTRGFAFNLLTSYSDADRMRSDLYYGEPSLYFDHCKRRYAKDVALLHDYGLYEFTILVRKELS